MYQHLVKLSKICIFFISESSISKYYISFEMSIEFCYHPNFLVFDLLNFLYFWSLYFEILGFDIFFDYLRAQPFTLYDCFGSFVHLYKWHFTIVVQLKFPKYGTNKKELCLPLGIKRTFSFPTTPLIATTQSCDNQESLLFTRLNFFGFLKFFCNHFP